MATLAQLRDAAVKLGRNARDLNAERSSTVISIVDGSTTSKYYIEVKRRFRVTGRGASKTRELERETVVVKENSQQGEVIYASPLEWLIDGEPKPPRS